MTTEDEARALIEKLRSHATVIRWLGDAATALEALLASRVSTPPSPRDEIRLHAVEGGFVVAGQAGWLPGVYKTAEAAEEIGKAANASEHVHALLEECEAKGHWAASTSLAEVRALIERLRSSYRDPEHGVVVVSPRLLVEAADALEAAEATIADVDHSLSEEVEECERLAGVIVRQAGGLRPGESTNDAIARVEASEVSAPPTITDEMVERAAFASFALDGGSERSRSIWDVMSADAREALRDRAHAALRAALGGEEKSDV